MGLFGKKKNHINPGATAFQAELETIRNASAPQFYVPTSFELEIDKQSCEPIIQSICEKIKDGIRQHAAQVARNGSNWNERCDKNHPTYVTKWNTAIAFACDQHIFSYEKILYSVAYSDPEKTDGFVINTPDLFFYILREIGTRLSKDGVYPIMYSHLKLSKYNWKSEGIKVKYERYTLPSQSQMQEVNDAYTSRKFDNKYAVDDPRQPPLRLGMRIVVDFGVYM